MNTIKSILIFILITFVIVGAALHTQHQKDEAVAYSLEYQKTKIELLCPFSEGSHMAFTARCPGTYQLSGADFVVGEDHIIAGYTPRVEGAKFVKTH